MKKTLLFIALASLITFTACGMMGGNAPVAIEEEIETIEIDTTQPSAQIDTTKAAVKVDSAALKAGHNAKKSVK
ncbi:MAG: hypothetical protein RR141_01450 [Rikenellaceae bacterium]